MTTTSTELVTAISDVWETIITTVTEATVTVSGLSAPPTLYKRQATVTPSVLPDYAVGPCSTSVARYVSACSCFGATPSVTYAPTPVVTSTVTVSTTSTLSCSETTTETELLTAHSTVTVDVPTWTTETIAATATICSGDPKYFFLQAHGTSPKDDTIDDTYINVNPHYNGATDDWQLRYGGDLSNAALFSFGDSNNVILTQYTTVDTVTKGHHTTTVTNADVLAVVDVAYSSQLAVNAYSNSSDTNDTPLSCHFGPGNEFICSVTFSNYFSPPSTFNIWTYDNSTSQLRIDDGGYNQYPQVFLTAVCAEYYTS